MPIADYATYTKMLDNAYNNGFAYPAINCTSMMTINAAMNAFAEMKTDGIIQFSTGAGTFASGRGVADSVEGCIALAEYAHRIAQKYDIYVALHTDHCQPDKSDSFLIPLIEESERRVADGKQPLFCSHMMDGSAVSLKDNMDLSVKLLERMAKIGMLLEVEAGVVGGEEEGAASAEGLSPDELYTTPEDMVEVYRRLSEIKDARYMFAATFGNVHGHYKPGTVKLRPKILKEGQEAIKKAYGDDAYFWLVFHGGSGSSREDIQETLNYGVVKMNVDTDTQYAFTRPIVDHMFSNYDGVMKVDGEVGDKKAYDPRGYLKKGEQGMTERVKLAVEDLKGMGKTIGG